jgi:hypothetical protein
MVQTLGRERVAECLHHMRLTHHFREISGAVFAGKNKIGHPDILNWPDKHFSAAKFD